MSHLHLPDTVSIAADEHGAVLLNSRGARMFGLNPTAAVFCTALAEGLPREDATVAVLAAFDGDEAEIRTDIDALVSELLRHDLAVEGA